MSSTTAKRVDELAEILHHVGDEIGFNARKELLSIARRLLERVAEADQAAKDWRLQYLESCAKRDAAIDRLAAENEQLESDIHQWDEWNAKAKVRYEEIVAENERLTRAFDLAANGCRRDAENHATEGNKLTAAYAAATARHLDSLLVGGEGWQA